MTAAPFFQINFTPHAQLEWDAEHERSIEGWGFQLDLFIPSDSLKGNVGGDEVGVKGHTYSMFSLIPTDFHAFDLPDTPSAWDEVLETMERWCSGRGWYFDVPDPMWNIERDPAGHVREIPMRRTP